MTKHKFYFRLKLEEGVMWESTKALLRTKEERRGYPMKFLHWVATLLVVIGAINWGLIGAFHFDAVSFLLHSSTSWAARAVYTIIGLAGVFKLKCLFCCKCCH